MTSSYNSTRPWQFAGKEAGLQQMGLVIMTQTASNPLFGTQLGPDPAAAPDLLAVATAVNPIYQRSVLDQDPVMATAHDSLALPNTTAEPTVATAAATATAGSAVTAAAATATAGYATAAAAELHADANVHEAAAAGWAVIGQFEPFQGIEEVIGEDGAATWLVGDPALQHVLHQASQVSDLV